jgi:small-conductance mechanosensitive channel
VYLLIWICGIYFAAAPLLSQLLPEQGAGIFSNILDILFNLGIFAVVFWFFFRFTHVLEARMSMWASRTSSRLDDLLALLLGRGLRVILPVIAVIFALPILGLPAAYAGVVSKGTSVLLIVAVAVVLFQAVSVAERALLLRFDIAATDNLQARKVYTQVHVIGRVIYVVIGLFAVACILMLFQEVRHVGTSLLASAGIVGIIAGIAGQKSLGNLFAGFQIALAQPIRQDDVVVVEGAWGRIEEITLTYVVVHVWDDTRLVLPLSYFIEKPFQNWTRTGSALLGTVFIYVDYTVPVERVREQLPKILETDKKWDGAVQAVQVTDAKESTIELRLLMSARNSADLFDLRCNVREAMIGFLQQNHEAALPRKRQVAVAPPISPSR